MIINIFIFLVHRKSVVFVFGQKKSNLFRMELYIITIVDFFVLNRLDLKFSKYVKFLLKNLLLFDQHLNSKSLNVYR
jgi:hypothetical protein